MSHQQLEKYRWFPYVAWTLSVGFALFVGNLALELHDATDRLHSTTSHLQNRLDEIERALQPGDTTPTTSPHERTN